MTRQVPGVSQIYPRHDQQTSPTYFLYMSWRCPRYMPDMSRHILGMSQIQPRHVQRSPGYAQAYPRCVADTSRDMTSTQAPHIFYICPGDVPDICQICQDIS